LTDTALHGPVNLGRSMQKLSQGKAALVLFLFGFLLAGCDIVQGFQDASAAVFPSEKTYLDAPGFRLARGNYRGLGFASGSSLYLLARSSESSNSSLYSMLYADPRPCELPNIKAHRPSEGVFPTASTIAFIEEGTNRGTLRFADGTCRLYDLAVPDSTLPFAELPEGFVIYQGSDLVLVNPVTGTTDKLVTGGAYVGSVGPFYLIHSAGRLGAFRSDWKEAGWFGKRVIGLGNAGPSLYFEDGDGIHRLTPSGGADPTIAETVIAPGGCTLGFPRPLGGAESWVTYYAPCADKRLMAHGETSGRSSAVGIVADPRYVAFMPGRPSLNGDPGIDPFFVFFLADVDTSTGLGSLRMQTPDGLQKTLGESAPLDRVTVVTSAAGVHGYALLDVNGDLGRFVRWEADGATQELATRVVRNTNDLVIDFDGETGSFALPTTGGGIAVVAERVVPRGFKSRDAKDRWTAVLQDVKETVGTLSITDHPLDFDQAAQTPGPPPNLEIIARGALGRIHFVTSVPGIAYLTNYDAKLDVGRLDYRNLELRFTATVSNGVSDYVPTGDGVIYTVPFGGGAGIWHVRSR
jgi:hypothetical protein